MNTQPLNPSDIPTDPVLKPKLDPTAPGWTPEQPHQDDTIDEALIRFLCFRSLP
jgi:hypothetical protein